MNNSIDPLGEGNLTLLVHYNTKRLDLLCVCVLVVLGPFSVSGCIGCINKGMAIKKECTCYKPEGPAHVLVGPGGEAAREGGGAKTAQ